MAPKSSSCIFCIVLVFLTIPNFTHATSSSPFSSIKHLQGCQKGETVKGLRTVKSYLQRFGYLNYENHPNQINRASDDIFDDELEAAIKTYQLNFDLKPTGVLDADTASKMAMPRCGVPDISNGTNHMLASRNKRHGLHNHHGNLKNLKTVSHFAFYGGRYIWPPGKKQLTYAFYQNVSPLVIASVARSFDQWASASKYFTFRVGNPRTADLKLGFERGRHCEGGAFDGPGGVAAHAFAPTDGKLHFDAAERWVIGAVPGSLDVGTVALHEIGHLLGLQHSAVPTAIMFPSVPMSAVKGLGFDDVMGIRTLYRVL